MYINTITKKTLYSLITLSWLIAMALLLQRHYGYLTLPVLQLQNSLTPKELFQEQWMGIYLHGEKVGYSSQKLTPFNEEFQISEEIEMKVNIMGTSKDIFTKTRAILDKDMTIVSFSSLLKSDLNIEIDGKVENNNLTITIYTDGRKSVKTIKLKKRPSLNVSLVANLMRGGLLKGGKVKIPIFDTSVFSIEDIEVEISDKEPIMVMGKVQDVYKLTGNFKNLKFTTWFTEKGEILREESSMGLTLIKETKEEALKYKKPSIDLIAQVSVPFNLDLPYDVSYLKVRISGIELKGLKLNGGRQTLRDDILEIRKESLESIDKRLVVGMKINSSGYLNKYLSETIFIQSKAPEVISLAKRIISDEKSLLKISELIYSWVYKNIKKIPVISIPMAVEVLKSRKGDCNEHTTLFTALTRAAGVPTRIAMGLVYVYNNNKAFYYHAWPEVYLREWVAIDPTLGQFPADATHIRLITGDFNEQTQLLSIIGKIKLEGIGYD